jgi:hypothetical protein
MKVPTGNLQGLTCSGIVGPWPCENCGNLAQYADVKAEENIIFCRACTYRRKILKRVSRIIEHDGSIWAYDNQGNKRRMRG